MRARIRYLSGTTTGCQIDLALCFSLPNGHQQRAHASRRYGEMIVQTKACPWGDSDNVSKRIDRERRWSRK